MNPQHREFFIKLRALCSQHSASVRISEDAERLSFRLDGETYETSWVGYGHSLHIIQPVYHCIAIDEEPQP